MTDIPIKDAMIAWTPVSDEIPAGRITVLRNSDRSTEAARSGFLLLDGACFKVWQDAEPAVQLSMLLDITWKLVLWDRLNPDVVHAALSVIPEYRDIVPPDTRRFSLNSETRNSALDIRAELWKNMTDDQKMSYAADRPFIEAADRLGLVGVPPPVVELPPTYAPADPIDRSKSGETFDGFATPEFMEYVKENYESEGDLEFCDTVKLCNSDDNGIYVPALKWVSFSGTKWDKEKEEDDEPTT